VFGFFIESYSTQNLLQNTFSEWKCLVSNWSYTRLIRTIKKVRKNRMKSLRVLCHRNTMQSSLHYSETYSGQ